MNRSYFFIPLSVPLFLCLGCTTMVSTLTPTHCKTFKNGSEEQKVVSTYTALLQSYNGQDQEKINQGLAKDVSYIRCDGNKCENYSRNTPYPNNRDWQKWESFQVDLNSVCIGSVNITSSRRALVAARYNFQYQEKGQPVQTKGVHVTTSFVKEGAGWKLQTWGNSLHKPFHPTKVSRTGSYPRPLQEKLR